MSFSAQVKQELLSRRDSTDHCRRAALCAVINLCGEFSSKANDEYVIVSSDNDSVLTLACELIGELTGIRCDITDIDGRAALVIVGSGAVKLLSELQLNSISEDEPVAKQIIARQCCKRAYLRTAFICCGSVTNPERAYHFEYVTGDYCQSAALKELAESFGIDAKITERKNHYVLYIKEGEQIVDMLNLISAHRALMEFENKRIVKEVRNNINRIVNCETANLNKVIKSSVRQVEAIRFIQQKVGLGYLSGQLEDVARLRLDNPDLSLKELGELLNPPVGKSGVNHRLTKICEIAKQLKGEL